jgi:hypothetical protein
MSCRDVDRVLIESGSLTRQAQDHLAVCGRCRELMGLFNASDGAEIPSPMMLKQLERTLVGDLRPVRALGPASHYAAAFAGIFLSIVAVAAYVMGAFAIAEMNRLQLIATVLALGASASLLAQSLAHQMTPGGQLRIPPRFLLAALMISLPIVVAGLFQFQHEDDFWQDGWVCLRAGVPLAVLAAIPFWLLLRCGAILSPPLTAAATGLLAGLTGTGVLAIHCPNMNASHILVWHLGAPALGVAAGLGIGFVCVVFRKR